MTYVLHVGLIGAPGSGRRTIADMLLRLLPRSRALRLETTPRAWRFTRGPLSASSAATVPELGPALESALERTLRDERAIVPVASGAHAGAWAIEEPVAFIVIPEIETLADALAVKSLGGELIRVYRSGVSGTSVLDIPEFDPRPPTTLIDHTIQNDRSLADLEYSVITIANELRKHARMD